MFNIGTFIGTFLGALVANFVYDILRDRKGR